MRSRRRSASSWPAGRSSSIAAGRASRPPSTRSGRARSPGRSGTYSHLAPDIEADVLAALGLHADPVSTQIVQRDRHAALLTAIAILGGSLERFATEVRNLQHTEIGELQEPFKPGQKGSSAMPHKRNPILSERIAGLARLLRGYAHTALEDQPLWHERDISHSSAERVILPDATIVLDYMLVRMTGLVEGLVVRPERMRENIERGLGLHASSRVLAVLIESGLAREDAYAIVQRAALRAADERVPLRDLLAVDATVAQRVPLASSTPASTTRRSWPTCRHPARWLSAWIDGIDACADVVPAFGQGPRPVSVPDGRLVLVASDRISAFDVVLPSLIPDKGRVLTGLSRFWFAETAGIVPNHLLDTDVEVLRRHLPRRVLDSGRSLDDLRGRIMICRPTAGRPD